MRTRHTQQGPFDRLNANKFSRGFDSFCIHRNSPPCHVFSVQNSIHLRQWGVGWGERLRQIFFTWISILNFETNRTVGLLMNMLLVTLNIVCLRKCTINSPNELSSQSQNVYNAIFCSSKMRCVVHQFAGSCLFQIFILVF